MSDCPICKKILINSDNCGLCGWNRTAVVPAESSTTVDTLAVEVLALLRCKNHQATAQDAMETIALWEPELSWERLTKRMNKDNTAAFISWPYRDRVLYLTRTFLDSAGELQRVILAANEDGIPWRGDTLERFHEIIAATEDFREGGGKRTLTARAHLTRLQRASKLPTRNEA